MDLAATIALVCSLIWGGVSPEAAVYWATEPTATERAEQWDSLAECESTSDWAINTRNGYYGGIQFHPTSWRAVGGTGLPHEWPRLEQMYRAERLFALQGAHAWPGCHLYSGKLPHWFRPLDKLAGRS